MTRFHLRSVATILATTLLVACSEDSTPGDGDGSGGMGGKSGSGGAQGGTSDKPKNTKGTIDTKGGKLETEGAVLAIPSGALTDDVEISVASLATKDIEALPETSDGVSLAAEPVAFLPHGLTFDEPVAVTLSYDAKSVSEGDLVVMKLDNAEDTTWEVVPGATFENGQAKFSVTSFSVYGVFEDPDGQASDLYSSPQSGSGGTSGSGGSDGAGGKTGSGTGGKSGDGSGGKSSSGSGGKSGDGSGGKSSDGSGGKGSDGLGGGAQGGSGTAGGSQGGTGQGGGTAGGSQGGAGTAGGSQGGTGQGGGTAGGSQGGAGTAGGSQGGTGQGGGTAGGSQGGTAGGSQAGTGGETGGASQGGGSQGGSGTAGGSQGGSGQGGTGQGGGTGEFTPGYLDGSGWRGFGYTFASAASLIESDLTNASAPNCAWGEVAAGYEEYVGLSYNINQLVEGDPETVLVQADGVFIGADYSAQEMRVQLSGAGATTNWCALLSRGEEFVPWSAFSTMCWDTDSPENVEFDPMMDEVQAVGVVVPGTMEEQEFDFCLYELRPGKEGEGSGQGGSGQGGSGHGGSSGMGGEPGYGGTPGDGGEDPKVTYQMNGEWQGYAFGFSSSGSSLQTDLRAPRMCAWGDLAEGFESFAGVGYNIDQPLEGEEPEAGLKLVSGEGISLRLRDFWAEGELRLQITGQEAHFCATLDMDKARTSEEQFVLWSDFSTMCWDPEDPSAIAFSPESDLVQAVAVVAPGTEGARSFDFCIEELRPSSEPSEQTSERTQDHPGMVDDGVWYGEGYTVASANSSIQSDVEEWDGPMACADGMVGEDYEDFASVGYSVASGLETSVQSDGVWVRLTGGGGEYRLNVVNSVTEEYWCAQLSGIVTHEPVFVPWTELNMACWDGSGEPFDPELDLITSVEVQVPSLGEAQPFKFCIETLESGAAPEGGSGGGWGMGGASGGQGEPVEP